MKREEKRERWPKGNSTSPPSTLEARQRQRQGKQMQAHFSCAYATSKLRLKLSWTEEKYRRWSPEGAGRRCSEGGGFAAQFWRSLHLWSVKKYTEETHWTTFRKGATFWQLLFFFSPLPGHPLIALSNAAEKKGTDGSGATSLASKPVGVSCLALCSFSLFPFADNSIIVLRCICCCCCCCGWCRQSSLFSLHYHY